VEAFILYFNHPPPSSCKQQHTHILIWAPVVCMSVKTKTNVEFYFINIVIIFFFFGPSPAQTIQKLCTVWMYSLIVITPPRENWLIIWKSLPVLREPFYHYCQHRGVLVASPTRCAFTAMRLLSCSKMARMSGEDVQFIHSKTIFWPMSFWSCARMLWITDLDTTTCMVVHKLFSNTSAMFIILSTFLSSVMVKGKKYCQPINNLKTEN
jgi:hypothetical protein